MQGVSHLEKVSSRYSKGGEVLPDHEFLEWTKPLLHNLRVRVVKSMGNSGALHAAFLVTSCEGV